MDDMEYLVAETFKHFQEAAPSTQGTAFAYEIEISNGPGLLYHLQKSTSVFVIRSFVSQNMREDFKKIVEGPENYPSLRLIEDDCDVIEKLKFHSVDTTSQAEIIHDQLNNRRFPIFEETLCNLSDPGFSWWLAKEENSFQVNFNLSVHLEAKNVKLGPLGDHQLASRNLNLISEVILGSGIDYSIQNEGNRIRFGEENPLLKEEFQNLFEFGDISENLKGIFKMIARRSPDQSKIETCWFYLEEIAAMRRFWIKIQYELMA